MNDYKRKWSKADLMAAKQRISQKHQPSAPEPTPFIPVRLSEDNMNTLPNTYDGLRGESWLSKLELSKLIDLVPLCGLVLEIGTKDGVSAAFVAKARPKSSVVSIDNYTEPTEWEPTVHLANYFYNRQPNQHLWLGDIINLFPVIDQQFDLILIDGNHIQSEVFKDGVFSSFLLKTGGTIAFHDYGDSNWTGVKKAVDTFLMKSNFVLKETVGSLAICKRKS